MGREVLSLLAVVPTLPSLVLILLKEEENKRTDEMSLLDDSREELGVAVVEMENALLVTSVLLRRVECNSVADL